MDLAEKMLDFARRLAPSVEFRVMDLRKLDFADGTFDGVWANSSLIFIKKKEAGLALGELCRVTKNGGCIFLRFKEGKGEGMAVDRRYGEAEKYTAYYTREELIRLVESSGFSVMLTERQGISYEYMTHPFIIAYCKK